MLESGPQVLKKVYFTIQFSLQGLSGRDITSVTAPIRSFLKNIIAEDGQYVHKGDALAILGHPEIIKLEQAFLEDRSEYAYRRTDLERQGELGLEHATSLKIQQAAQNEFQKAEIRYRSLQKQLEFIGINADSLSADNIGPDYLLKSPSSGYLNYGNIRTGMLCTESNSLFTIIHGQGSLVKLTVHDSLYRLISSESRFFFYSSSTPGQYYEAKLLRSQESNCSPGKCTLNAKILSSSANLRSGTMVRAIFVNEDISLAIPSESIFRTGERNHIFIKRGGDSFIPKEIAVGNVENGKYRLLRGLTDINKDSVVISGVTYLNELLKK